MGSPETCHVFDSSENTARALAQNAAVFPAKKSCGYSPRSALFPSIVTSPFGSYPDPPISKNFPPAYTVSIASSFFVMVPVLSTAMTRACPNASTACNLFTNTLRLLILHTPVASTRVITIGRPSGMIETASDTTVVNIVLNEFPRIIPRVNMEILTPATTAMINRDRYRMFALRGISVSINETSVAIFPITVLTPVSTTIALPFPDTT